MNKVLLLISILAILLSSCYDQVYYSGEDVDCYKCYEEFPENAYLKIDFTLNSNNKHVPITIYNGLVDKSPIVYHAICDSTPIYVKVPINNIYSVKAGYKYNNDSVFAIDNAKIEAKLVVGLCDEDCWYIVGGEYNVKLVY